VQPGEGRRVADAAAKQALVMADRPAARRDSWANTGDPTRQHCGERWTQTATDDHPVHVCGLPFPHDDQHRCPCGLVAGLQLWDRTPAARDARIGLPACRHCPCPLTMGRPPTVEVCACRCHDGPRQVWRMPRGGQ
jgi:hypothetical protein